MSPDSSPLFAPTSFRELYCAFHQLAPEAYERAVFHRGLYGHARWLAWVVERLGLDGYFAPDREFVRGVGGLTSTRWFHVEAANYHTHPEQERFLRRILMLRVSAGRLRAVLDETFARAQRDEGLSRRELHRWREKYREPVDCGWLTGEVADGVQVGH